MDSVTMLTKPPFDKPLGFTRSFDKKMQMEIMAAINKVKQLLLQLEKAYNISLTITAVI